MLRMSNINASKNSLYNTNYLFGTQNKKKQDSISQLWSNYTSSQENATGVLAGLNEVNANLTSLLASHDDTKKTFDNELSENLTALSKSAAKVKDYNFNVEKEGAITTSTSTDEDGNFVTTITYSKELEAALKTVEDFVADYNSSIDFFKDNASISKRVANLANVFGDTTYRAANYESIGLIVNSDGSFTINEGKLADSIINSPDKVSSILGKDGLAGKAEAHINFANGQSKSLFPAVEDMFGDQIKTASIYTGKAYRNMNAYANMGNLLNMMF